MGPARGRHRAWGHAEHGGGARGLRGDRAARRSDPGGVFGGESFRYRYPNGDEVEATVVVFECAVVGGQLEPVDGESLELRWFPIDEAPALRLGYPADLLHPRDGCRFQ